MAMGGARPGAGRKKGVPNKRTIKTEEIAKAAGITPLEYLLNVMKDDEETPDRRIDAAKAAAPYVHPKLSAVALSGNLSVSHEDALAKLK